MNTLTTQRKTSIHCTWITIKTIFESLRVAASRTLCSRAQVRLEMRVWSVDKLTPYLWMTNTCFARFVRANYWKTLTDAVVAPVVVRAFARVVAPRCILLNIWKKISVNAALAGDFYLCATTHTHTVTPVVKRARGIIVTSQTQARDILASSVVCTV